MEDGNKSARTEGDMTDDFKMMKKILDDIDDMEQAKKDKEEEAKRISGAELAVLSSKKSRQGMYGKQVDGSSVGSSLKKQRTIDDALLESINGDINEEEIAKIMTVWATSTNFTVEKFIEEANIADYDADNIVDIGLEALICS